MRVTSAAFDSIPHDELLKSVARRIVDRHVLRLIKLWLKAPIEEQDDGDGTRRIGGGKSNTRGTPQGGVASPLLASIYMNRFLKYWRLTGRGVRGVDRYVYERVRDFLARRHKVAGRGTHVFSCDVVYGERGLLRLERLPLTASLRASR